MAAQGKAEVVWSGSLATGEGHAEFESGAGGSVPVTCALEDQTPAGKSTPEELLAAAHASCFAMALSQMLTMAHHKPEHLRVAVTTTLDQVQENEPFLITREDLDVSGRVPGIDEAGFLQAVEAAKTMCAVGLAIKNNVEIAYQAHLEREVPVLS
jgi:osmotically inducible protein OsmC